MSGVARLIADAVPALVAELSASQPGRIYLEALTLMERPLLEHVLDQTRGNQLQAARLLGINRNTLRSRLRAVGLRAPRAGSRCLRTEQPSNSPAAAALRLPATC